jgi:two-component system LytT family response regulator
MRVLIVDDEHLARAVLREHLAAHADVEIVGDCANGFEAVKAIAELAPDLVFLDIQMPKLDGFEVVELAGGAPQYVFVTAYDEYALRAFEVHAVDYLMKPFSAARLSQALSHARDRAADPGQVEALVEDARGRHRPLERILIRDGARVHVVATSEVDYIEAQDDYVQIAAGGRRYLKNQRLSSLETQLDPALFLRIHRSWIVNLGAVVRIEPLGRDSHCAVLRGDVRVPISRSGYQKVRELIR